MLAVIVVLWFVVLVPMMLTHRDLSREATAGDRVAPGARVLSRRRPARAVPAERRYAAMSSTGSSPSVPPVDEQRASTRATDEPAPEVSSSDVMSEHAEHEDDEFDSIELSAHELAVERSAERRAERIRAARRRRDLLLGLIGLAVLSFILALAITPVFWILQVGADIGVAAYVVRLRRGTVRRERREERLAARLRPTAKALLDVEATDREEFSTDWRGQLGVRERPGARARAEAMRARLESDANFAEAHTDRFAAIRPEGYRVVDIDEDDPTFQDMDTYGYGDTPTYRSYGGYEPQTYDADGYAYDTDAGYDAHGGYAGYDTVEDDEPYEPPKVVNG